MTAEEFADRPKEVCIEVTTDCNSKCIFCYNQNTFAQHGRDHVFLSGVGIRRIVDKIQKAGISRVRFTGGEPLLREDIFDLAEYARERQIVTVLNTNGTLVNERNASRIIESFDICLVSFPSLRPEYLDSVTGMTGTYARKVRALQLLQGCRELWCSTVIGDPDLARDLSSIYKLMQSYDVVNWFLLRANPVALNRNPHSFCQIEAVVDGIIALEEDTGALVNIGNPLPFCCYKPERLAKIVNDGVLYAEARSKLTINPYGKIVVDYCIDTVAGEALAGELLDAWRGGILTSFRGTALLPRLCGRCRYAQACKGGSRFAAKMAYGKYDEMDPLARPESYRGELFASVEPVVLPDHLSGQK